MSTGQLAGCSQTGPMLYILAFAQAWGLCSHGASAFGDLCFSTQSKGSLLYGAPLALHSRKDSRFFCYLFIFVFDMDSILPCIVVIYDLCFFLLDS